MPYWYYDKKDLRNTPSFRDGIDFEVERRYRKEGARFIMQIGTTMGLGHNTIATGIVYYHRFYMLHSFKTFPRYVTASCCLFLAGKVEETPKKCKDIIKMAKSFLSEQKFLSFGEDPKEEVMTLERILLQTIKFDLQVDHPYNFLVKYAKCLKGDPSKLQKTVQMAWNFVNDSLSTTLCLQWEPEIIAVALIYLACKLSKFNVVDWQGRTKDHLKWWDMFVKDITMDVLEDICHQVLDLYQKLDLHEGDESPPQQPPSRAASPPSKKVKMTMQASQPSGVPVIVPQPGPPSGPSTPLKPAQPSGNNIPVKVLRNDGSVDPQQPHKIGKIMNNNVHYAAPYPSTSGYGYASTSSLPQQPPPPPIPPPVHSNPHHQPPPPPYTNNLHSHNSAGYSSRSVPPQPGPQIPSYNAPPPPSTAYHPPLHHGAPPPGPPLPMSHHYQSVNANYYPNSQHHHRNHRNSNYHYPPH